MSLRERMETDLTVDAYAVWNHKHSRSDDEHIERVYRDLRELAKQSKLVERFLKDRAA